MNIKNLFFVFSLCAVFVAKGMSDQIGRMQAFGDKKFIFEISAKDFFDQKDIDFGALTLNSAQCYYSLRKNKGCITFEKKVGNNIFVSYLKPEINKDIENRDDLKNSVGLLYLKDYQNLTGFYVKRIKKNKKTTFEFRPKYKFFHCYAKHVENWFNERPKRNSTFNIKIKNKDSNIENSIINTIQNNSQKDQNLSVEIQPINFDVMEAKEGNRKKIISVMWNNINEESQIKLEKIGITEATFNQKNVTCDIARLTISPNESPKVFLKDGQNKVYILRFVSENPWFFQFMGEKR